MKTKRLIILLLMTVLIGQLLVLLVPPKVKAAVQAQWVDKGTIKIGNDTYVDGKPDDNSRDYYKQGGGVFCPDVIRDFSPDNTTAKLHKQATAGSSCFGGSTTDITFDAASLPNATKAPGGSDGGGDIGFNCSWSFNPLTWFMCPMIEGLEKIVNVLDHEITNFLTVPGKYFDSSDTKSGQKFYKAWASFRTIALVLLVIIGLVMVISQALSFGPFDAYTVKKLLPRIFLAVILVTLSWSIMGWFVGLTNDLGAAVRGIITAPFGGGNINFSGSAESVGAIGLAVAGGALGILGILSLVATAALAVIIAFAILLFRQLLIIMLAILAPIAIILFILPNTEKYWKIWWESFSKALLMFPIIAAFIATGRVFAQVITEADHDLVHQLFAFAAYFAPYFLLPAAFKLAGGALSTISGMANDRGRGVFDRLKKGRQGQVAKNWADTKGGRRLRGGTDTNLRGRFNRGLQGAALINKGGLNPMKMRDRLNVARGTSTHQEIEQNKKENADYARWMMDDDLNRAASESTDEASLRDALRRSDARAVARGGTARFNSPTAMNQAVASVQAVRRGMSTDAFRQMTTSQAFAGGTAYDTAAEVWAAAGAAAGNDDAALASMVAQGRSSLMSAGRVDQGGAGFGDTMAVAQGLRDGTMTAAQANQRIHQGVLESQGAGTIAHSSMKRQAVEQLIPQFRQRLADARATGNLDLYDRELAIAANLYDSLAASSPQNARVFGDGVMNWDASTGVGAPITPISAGAAANNIQSDVESRRQSRTFLTTRRELSAQAAGAGVVGGGGGLPGPGGPPIAPPPPPPSDKRLKRNILNIGVTVNGIKLYSFQYLWNEQVYVGVMAQDLIDTHPEALSTDINGFYLVDYSILGLKMMTLEEWATKQVKPLVR